MTSRINLTVIPNFLLPHECDYFINQKLAQLQRSSVVCPNTSASVLDDHRTSSGSHFDDNNDPFINYLNWKISAVTRVDVKNFEKIQILRYDVGQQYKPHHDYFSGKNLDLIEQGGNRIKTALIYLNTVDLGGETYFPHLSMLVKPEIGKLVVWDNLYSDLSLNPLSMHAGLPVIHGEKFVLTCWIREKGFLC